MRRYGTYASIRLCEAYLKVQRLQEEVVLLRKEARQYLQYCESSSAHLDRLVSRVLAGEDLTEIFLPTVEAGRYFSGDALSFESPTMAEALCSGVASLLLKAQTEVRDLLVHAQSLFGGWITETAPSPTGVEQGQESNATAHHSDVDNSGDDESADEEEEADLGSSSEDDHHMSYEEMEE